MKQNISVTGDKKGYNDLYIHPKSCTYKKLQSINFEQATIRDGVSIIKNGFLLTSKGKIELSKLYSRDKI